MKIPKVLCWEDGNVVCTWIDRECYTLTFTDEDTPPDPHSEQMWVPAEVIASRRIERTLIQPYAS